MNRLGFLAGTAFGFLIGAARLNDYDVIHNMLLLRDPDPYLVMGAAAAVALPLLWMLERRAWRAPLGGTLHLARARVERKHVAGSVVFGAGWALTGTCPGTALAMPSAGVLLGLPVVLGLFVGQMLREAVAARLPKHEAPSQPSPRGVSTAR